MAVFRVERTQNYTVMCNHHLKDLDISLKAKGLLSVILSLPDSWNYTTRGLASLSKDGVDSVGKALKELERAGYIKRRLLRDKNGRIADTEYTIFEKPQRTNDTEPNTGQPDTDNPDTVKPNTDNPAQLSTKELNTDKSITDLSITHSFFQPQETEGMNGNDERNRIKNQIEYDCMAERYSKRQLDELVEIMLEVALNRSQTIRIGRDQEYPREYVQERFSKINASHIERVMEGIEDNQTPVKSTKAYLLAVLFNSVSTLDHYYTIQANADYVPSSYTAKPAKRYEMDYSFEPGESL